MTRTARLNPIILLAFLVLMLGSASAVADDTFEEKLTAPGTISLNVDTGSGSIKVTGGSGRDITVIGKVKVQNRGIFGSKPDNADEILQAVLDNPPVELEGDTLTVGHIEDRSVRKYVSISYEITVPADTSVRADSGSGSVLITDIAADVNADTGSGSIKLRNIGGEVTADTGSGSIVAEGVAGGFNGDTGSGSITLSQTAPGDVFVDTGSGSIKLTGVVGALEAEAGSGSISVQGEQTGDWTLDSGSGSISITLPDDAAFDLDAETNSGGISIADNFPVEGRISKKHVEGSVNGGGHSLRIDTGSGGIKVK